jgi:hypothetical protein
MVFVIDVILAGVRLICWGMFAVVADRLRVKKNRFFELKS